MLEFCPMTTKGIVPVKLSLTQGDFYTLWAPKWREHGAEWQGFLGAGDDLYVFNSPAEMLVFLESGAKHDLSNHPKWGVFDSLAADRVLPGAQGECDIVGVPALLAGRPSHESVRQVARCFTIARAFGDISGDTDTQVLFATHSVLGNVERGSEHFGGDAGFAEWTAIGHVVLNNWDTAIDCCDNTVTVREVDSAKVADAQNRIDAAVAAAEKARTEEEERRKTEAEKVDPYDTTVWAASGIDPIKVHIDGHTVYTLRTYVQGLPVFLGRYGQINTFTNPKSMLRWLIEHEEHDLAKVSTWGEVMTGVNAGELDINVHADNVYSFNGITRDIAKGPEAVDREQIARAYELLADAADWAGDDSLNSFFLANPRFQDYIAYLTGSTTTAGYTPTPPFSDHVESWKSLEEMLMKRFSK